MFWANFLHFYQPIFQQPDILEAVVAQSYRPILLGVAKHKQVRLTLNLNGALLELFDKYGYRDLIDTLRTLGKSGRVEFTGSAKYHGLLPFLTPEEAARQIKINDETNRFFLGEAYKPMGLFPPEMAWSKDLAPVVEDLGFRWVILDEIAQGGKVGQVDYRKIYQIKGSSLLVFFRQRRLSNLIMSAVVRDWRSLKAAMGDELASKNYLVTAMDGETFGHHRPGLEKMLFQVFAAKEMELVTISELIERYHNIVEVIPVASTWASSEEDIGEGKQFISWADPENVIHSLQRELLDLVLAQFSGMDKNLPDYQEIRRVMDVCLSSDHFFWASGKPWWSLEMIEDGAYRLLTAIRSIPNVPAKTLARAGQLYEKIVSTAFDWQRTGKIRKMAKEGKEVQRIPFIERTLGRAEKGGSEAAEAGVYYAFVDMMKKLERQAAGRGEYEQAILWRDAIYKLGRGLDIYDTINAIDLLRVRIPHGQVEQTVAKYKTKYQKIRGGQPEQRG